MFDIGNRSIFLWGTGSRGQSVHERLRRSVRFAGAINNLRSAGISWNGLPVLTAAEALDGTARRPFVVLAVAAKFLEEIAPELEQRGLQPYIDWCDADQAEQRLSQRPRVTRPAGTHDVLRVLHLNWQIWGNGFAGGHVAHAEALIEALSRQSGLEHAYLYTAGRRAGGAPDVVESRRGELRVFEIVDNPIYSSWAPPLSDLDEPAVERLVDTVVDAYQPALVHVHHLIQFPLAAVERLRHRHGVPVVASVRDYWYVCKQATLMNHHGSLCDATHDSHACGTCLSHATGQEAASRQAFLARRYRYLHFLETCEAVTYVSAFLRAEYGALGLSGKNSAVCRNGTSLRVPSTSRPPGRPRSVAFLGQIKDYKGAYFVLDTLRRWRGAAFNLHMWGQAEDEARFTRAVAALPARITATFHGSYQRASIPEMLRNIDVGLVPSQVADTAPQVLMEFAACRVPVVAARIGGIPESVRDGRNGLLFEPRNGPAFLAALERTMDDSVWRRLRDGIEAPRSIGAYAAEIRRLYDRVAAGAGVPVAGPV